MRSRLGATDHDLDDLVHRLPLREVVQELHGADPAEETRATY